MSSRSCAPFQLHRLKAMTYGSGTWSPTKARENMHVGGAGESDEGRDAWSVSKLLSQSLCQVSGVKNVIAFIRESKIGWRDTLFAMLTTDERLLSLSGVGGKERDDSVGLQGDSAHTWILVTSGTPH